MPFFSSLAKIFGFRKPARERFLNHWYKTSTRERIPGGHEIRPRLLVIHFTAGASARSSIHYWRQLANGVGAHFIIGRDGRIYQCRPANYRIGHAGKSEWTNLHTGETLVGLNGHSIGIELANGGHVHPAQFSHLPPTSARHKHESHPRLWETYTEAQLKACRTLSRDLVEAYGLEAIVGHDDISPARRLDPGPAFPMQELRRFCGL